MRICPVILCGGSGSRLWPLSRGLYPKQFMELGGHTLFGDVLERVQHLGDTDTPLVVSNKEQRFLAANQMQEHGLQTNGQIILEPQGRNTAPAIALAALALQTRHAKMSDNEDPVMLVLPSDHAMNDPAAFAQAVKNAVLCAQAGFLVTFGITPNRAETGYGYIQQGEALGQELGKAFRVSRFVEKPQAEVAQAMLASGGYFWNSGMFCFSVATILQELQIHAPEIFDKACVAWEARKEEYDFIWLDEKFLACPADSIDYAVMEKTAKAAVLPLHLHWSDLGSWQAVYDATEKKDAQNNVCTGDVLLYKASNNYLHSSQRLLVALGVEGLAIVESADAVLVTPLARSQEVKNVVNDLVRLGRDEYSTHLRVYRPWGWYETLAQGECFQVKRIMVASEAGLSLQLHHKRAEHWVVVNGVGQVTLGEETSELKANQSVYIPIGVKHRLVNATDQPLILIEIQSGSYLGEDDIVRFEDRYGRK